MSHYSLRQSMEKSGELEHLASTANKVFYKETAYNGKFYLAQGCRTQTDEVTKSLPGWALRNVNSMARPVSVTP